MGSLQVPGLMPVLFGSYCGFKTCINEFAMKDWFSSDVKASLMIEILFCNPGKIFVVWIIPVSWTSLAHVNSVDLCRLNTID